MRIIYFLIARWRLKYGTISELLLDLEVYLRIYNCFGPRGEEGGSRRIASKWDYTAAVIIWLLKKTRNDMIFNVVGLKISEVIFTISVFVKA